jgi:hypothetical protein
MVDPDARSRTGAHDADDVGDGPVVELRDGGGDAVQRVDPDDELPVVARLVIEIRSDGSRTVARGALEQAELGERVGVEARGGSPAALAADLLRAIISLPLHSTLSRWTGPKEQVPKASLDAAREPGVVGRVREALTGRLRRKLGLDR